MNNSVTIAYRFEITLQLCFFDGSKPKNNDENQARLSNFFKNFDSNGSGDDFCYQGGLDQRFRGLYHQKHMYQGSKRSGKFVLRSTSGVNALGGKVRRTFMQNRCTSVRFQQMAFCKVVDN
ncbi:hypothetical protein Tco_1458990 [Tanacetum coccineum]